MNLSIFLAAVAVVESNTNDLAIGKAGERSRYQITPLVWNAHSHPKADPFNPDDAKLVAYRYCILELLPALQRHERSITAASLAACWNYGPKAASKPWPKRVQRYSDKVVAAYTKLSEQEEFLQPTP